MNYRIVEIDRNNLPQKLKVIKKVPEKLYAIGNIQLLNEDCFAIVGTRNISDYGKKVCRYFTKEFALRRITTVSGMAIGTDTIVHDETIENGGTTIAVLGSGFDNIFPEENVELFHKIIKSGGLVLSEYNPSEKAKKENFPKRNRLISGISEGVLVIEAAYRSGTSITAKNAVEQGKTVFAVPGMINSTVGVGVNNLIKEGAILTTKIEDVLLKYPQFMNKKRINVSQRTLVKSEYKEILKFLSSEDKCIDEIAQGLEIELKDALITLSKMEEEGLVCQDFLGKYKIRERS